MVSDVMGQCKQWDLHCSVFFYKGAHEYPVLDRHPGSNDLELHFRWVCAVSCARKTDKCITILHMSLSNAVNCNHVLIYSHHPYKINVSLWNTTVCPRWQESLKSYFSLQGQSQGHKVIEVGVIWKGVISGVCMQNMKSLSLKVQKL